MKIANLILVSIWALAPLVYFLFRKIRPYTSATYYLKYARETEKGYNLVVRITPERWPPFFFDTWLTPRFEVTVENRGIPISSGRLFFKRSFYPGESLKYPGDFSDLSRGRFDEKTLENFENGETRSFLLSLESKHIEPNRLYRLEAICAKSILIGDGMYQIKPLIHFRTSDAFRVHPFSTLLAITFGYPAALVAVLAIISYVF